MLRLVAVYAVIGYVFVYSLLVFCIRNYSVSQKKTSPTFLAVTRESIVGFS